MPISINYFLIRFFVFSRSAERDLLETLSSIKAIFVGFLCLRYAVRFLLQAMTVLIYESFGNGIWGYRLVSISY